MIEPLRKNSFSRAPRAVLAVLAIAAVAPATATAAPGGEAVPGEVVVKFRAQAPPVERGEARDRIDASVAEKAAGVAGLQLLELAPGERVGNAVDQLEGDPRVAYAEPNYVRELHMTPDDPKTSGNLWGLDNQGQTVQNSIGVADADIDAYEAWEKQTGSSDTVVAVIDTGIDPDHEDLSGNLWTNSGEVGNGRQTNGIDDDGNGYVDDWRGWDFASADNDPRDGAVLIAGRPDQGGHGTHVAGTIGATGNNSLGVTGVAWDVRLMSLKIFATQPTSFSIASAFRYADDNGADIVNGSFGGAPASQAELDALTSASDTLFVFSAGNDAKNVDQTPAYPCAYDVANVICVAATDNRDRLASFSNYGPRSVDIAAPGVDIGSTRASYQVQGATSHYYFLSGTSMAAPMVSGAAAVLISNDPTASVAELRAALLGGVDQLDSLAGQNQTNGRLNLDHALDILTPPPANDAFAKPTELSGTSVTRSADSNVSATKEQLEPRHAGNLGGGSVWYRWTAPRTAEVTISTSGSSFDTLLAAYTGSSPTGLTEVASNDDWPIVGHWSAVDFTAVRGTTYRIAVDGFAPGLGRGARGTVALSLEQDAPALPDTAIDSGPEGTVASSTASFTFSGSGDVAGFECRLDEATWGSCDSPHELTGLNPGEHLLEVRAVNDAGADPSPASRRWVADPPVAPAANTRIRSGPRAIVTRGAQASAKFRFTGTDASDFECRLDDEGWRACSSPTTVSVSAKRRKLGHRFEVRALNRAGEPDATPAYRDFTVQRRRR